MQELPRTGTSAIFIIGQEQSGVSVASAWRQRQIQKGSSWSSQSAVLPLQVVLKEPEKGTSAAPPISNRE